MWIVGMLLGSAMANGASAAPFPYPGDPPPADCAERCERTATWGSAEVRVGVEVEGGVVARSAVVLGVVDVPAGVTAAPVDPRPMVFDPDGKSRAAAILAEWQAALEADGWAFEADGRSVVGRRGDGIALLEISRHRRVRMVQLVMARAER